MPLLATACSVVLPPSSGAAALASASAPIAILHFLHVPFPVTSCSGVLSVYLDGGELKSALASSG